MAFPVKTLSRLFRAYLAWFLASMGAMFLYVDVNYLCVCATVGFSCRSTNTRQKVTFTSS